MFSRQRFRLSFPRVILVHRVIDSRLALRRYWGVKSSINALNWLLIEEKQALIKQNVLYCFPARRPQA